MKHGTTTGYRYGCRCQECRQAEREAQAAYQEAYRAAHREESRAYHAAYRAAHREERRAAAAAYYAAHKEQGRAARRAYAAAHPEAHRKASAAYRASHPDEAREATAAWQAAHPENGREARRRRRARIAGVESEPFTLRDVIDRDGWRCGICGRNVKPGSKGRDRPSLDHIVPLAQGGPHTLANAQLAHFGCNSAKGHRDRMASQLRLFG